ncbi:MAG: Hpt domain-containing protein [Thermoplasmata archaeon]
MSDGNPVDPEALDRLREWGGDQLVGQMIRLFLENSETRMEQIRAGLEKDDADEAGKGAHSLKSSAANVGAHTVRALAAAMEQQAGEGNLASMKTALPALEEAFRAARDELENLERGLTG